MPFSCFLFRPRKRLVKSAGNAVIPTFPMHRSTRTSTPPAQTRPRSLSRAKAGTHSAFGRRIAHNGSHAETGVFRTGAVSLPSERSARSQTSPGRVSERRTLPLLGLGRVCSRRTQKAFGTAMRLMRVAVPRRRGPAGLRDLFATSVEVAVFSLCAQYFLNVRGEGWYHYPRRALRAAETLDGRLSKRLSCHYWGATSFEVG